jgi:hypothetical protein
VKELEAWYDAFFSGMTRAADIINDTEMRRSKAILALEIELGLDPIRRDYETDYSSRDTALDLERALGLFFHGGHVSWFKGMFN